LPEDQAFIAFETVETAAGPRLIAVTAPSAGGGVVSLILRQGLPPLVAHHADLTGMGAQLFRPGVSVATPGGQTLLVISGQGGAGIGGFTIAGNGSIGPPVSFSADHGLLASAPTALRAATFGERSFVFAGEVGGGLRVYELLAGNSLVAVDHEADAGNRYLASVTRFAVAEAAGQPVLLSLSGTEHGIMSHRFDPASGQLAEAGRVGREEGLGVDGLTCIDTVAINGQTFAVVGGANSSSLSVIRIGPDGTLGVTDHVIDTLDTRFAGVSALDIVQAAGWTFVVAGGRDGGITLFALLGDGTLVHLQSIADSGALTLDSISAIAGAVVGNELQIIVASETEPGLSVFALPLSALGVSLAGSDAAATISGDAGGNVILGGAGNEVLRGLGGRDILKDGAGADTLWGGTGADIFVMSADGAADTIQDFEPGVDRLDLSAWPMLYHPSQLTFTPTGIGAILSYRGETLTIVSAIGTPLTPAQVFPGGIAGPNRPPLVLFDAPFLLTGTAAADSLAGGNATDTIHGLAGNDTIAGLGGDDSLFGGDGADVIEGGDGNDRIDGGAQADTIRGGAGDDTVTGGLGPDRIWLGDGNDVFEDSVQNDAFGADWIDGGAGDDTIRGDSGADTMLGGDGNDLILGGRGANSLDGGAGNDTIHAGDGDDSVWGGTGADWITLGAGNDIFRDDPEAGPSGADWIDAGDGRDTVLGGGGNDTILGGGGEDLLEGGAGDDSIDGGAQADTIWGGAGNDTIRGGLGRDVVYMGVGDDVFHDEPQNDAFGADWVEGGAGNDTIWGGGGNDTLFGGAGDDWIEGGPGYDTIHGGQGNDTVRGGPGRDLAFLNDGNDVFFDDAQGGIHGRDTVWGGAGNDTIHAGGGDDEFWGEGGADTFVFSRGDGHDRIMDYVPGVDRIVFEVTGLRFADLTITQQGADTLIRYGDDSLLLAGVDAAGIWADHFSFL
jgi:Ca2+-binding RTX toxin-like protein